MNRYLTPFKREFWEHKGSFVWLPGLLGLLICLLMAGALTSVALGAFDHLKDGHIEIRFDSDEPENPRHFSREHRAHMHEALAEAHADLVRTREQLGQPGSDYDAAEVARELAEAEAELAEAQAELAEQGIHIAMDDLMRRVDERAIRQEVERSLDREIANLEAQMAMLAKQDSLLPQAPPAAPQAPQAPDAPHASEPTQAPVAPTAPAAPMAESEGAGKVRTFPSEIIVIESDENARQAFSDDNVEDMNKVIKVFFAVFSALMIVVSVFYLLGCLFSDRKDQSILFWKSMPVSETQQVLTKLITGLVLLPTLAVIVATVVALVFQGLAMLFVGLYSPTTTAWELWSGTHPLALALNHWFIALGVSLWSLPFYAWLLFTSAAAKRSPLVLALVPPALLMLFEQIVFDSRNLASVLLSRVPSITIDDNARSGFLMFEREGLADVAQFIASPGLWIGAIVAAALLAGAIWLRNHRYEI